MKDALFFRVGHFFDKASDWAFQQVSDTYLIVKEAELDHEVEDRMYQMGMTKVTIYRVNEGPIHRDSIPDDEGLPDGLDWLLEVKCRMDDNTSIVDICCGWFVDGCNMDG